MRKGKHMRRKKHTIFLVALILALDIAAGSTLAFLVTRTDAIKNTFNYSNVACKVIETFENDKIVKSDVKVQNSGDTESYIRAAIIVTWKDASGNVYARPPVENVYYTIEIDTTASGWIERDDGFYYYTKPVSPGAETGILIKNCQLIHNGPEGYNLSVEILASAIQSKPKKAVEYNWDVTVKPDGTIS